MKATKTGLLIGRFQPFHNGHAYLIKQALIQCDTVVVGIGSSNVENSDNPWSFEARRDMVQLFITHENLTQRIRAIIAIEDTADDAVWANLVEQKVKGFDIVFGNNDWVNGIMKMRGYDIVRFPFLKRFLFEGKKIRTLMRDHKPWWSRVPAYIADYISEHPIQI